MNHLYKQQTLKLLQDDHSFSIYIPIYIYIFYIIQTYIIIHIVIIGLLLLKF
jgi:hypothetical protein